MAKTSPTPAKEIAAYDREARVVQLRSEGHTFRQIAELTGFASGSGASQAWDRALARRVVKNVQQVRAQEADRLEFLWDKCGELVRNPPLQHSANGKVVTDPRTGEYVINQSAAVQAIREYRQISESYRKLTGADLASPETAESQASKNVDLEEFKAEIAQLYEDRNEMLSLRLENEGLRLDCRLLREKLAEMEITEAQVILSESWR